eukprot:PhM_4_TR1764/c0_g1_i2/m.27403
MNIEDLEGEQRALANRFHEKCLHDFDAISKDSDAKLTAALNDWQRELVLLVMSPAVCREVRRWALHTGQSIATTELDARYELLKPALRPVIDIVVENTQRHVRSVVQAMERAWLREGTMDFIQQSRAVTRHYVVRYTDHMHDRYERLNRDAIATRNSICLHAAQREQALTSLLVLQTRPTAAVTPALTDRAETPATPRYLERRTDSAATTSTLNLLGGDVIQRLKHDINELRERNIRSQAEAEGLEHTLSVVRRDHNRDRDALIREYEGKLRDLASEKDQEIADVRSELDALKETLECWRGRVDNVHTSEERWREVARRLTMEVTWLSLTLSRHAGPEVLAEVEKRLSTAPLEKIDVATLRADEQVLFSEIKKERYTNFAKSVYIHLDDVQRTKMACLAEAEAVKRKALRDTRALVIEHSEAERKLQEENLRLKQKLQLHLSAAPKPPLSSARSTPRPGSATARSTHRSPTPPTSSSPHASATQPEDAFAHMYCGTRVAPQPPPSRPNIAWRSKANKQRRVTM